MPFPLDVCVIHIEESDHKYAAALHRNEKGSKQFTVLKIVNKTHEPLGSYALPNALSMDCTTYNGKGFVSIVEVNITKHVSEDTATIYEITSQHVKPIQSIKNTQLKSTHLHVSDNECYLFQITSNGESCPYFKWSSDKNFKHIGTLHCPNNTENLKPFTINQEAYIAMAVNDDNSSKIFKYSRSSKQFELYQNIETTKAKDVEYFQIQERNEDTKHYLIFASSGEDNSIVYFFNDQKRFVPYQKLSLNRVKKIQVIKFEMSCLLMASCSEDDILAYRFDNGKFMELQLHFTGQNFHLYRENDKPFLLISHSNAVENQAVLYEPIFKDVTKLQKLKQDISEWLEQESRKLQINDIEKLAAKVQLVYPKKKMSSNYWQTLCYINQALKILEDEVVPKHPTKRQTKESDHEESSEYVYETLNIKQLTIDNKLEAKIINKINIENPEFQAIHADKITIFEQFLKPLPEDRSSDLNYMEDNEVLMIENLNINGKLNEFTWMELLNDTLKREGDQQLINAPNIKIKNLETSRLVVTSNVVNQQHLSTLIPIDGGEYVINQDIQFAQPIRAKSVQINERLNNVNVLQGKLDVLLRRSNETQIIEGPKSMRNVKVMEPVTIAGQMLGKHLESITPNKAIHQPLVLQGDFMINGDVDINRLLKTGDIIDLREKMSVKQTLERGIRMNQHMEDIKLKFLQPLKANNTLVSFVNRNDLQRLVKLNQDEIQIIEGPKRFAGSLEISRGFSEFKNLNGIDMEKLEKNSFLRNNNQTITVPVKFGKIQAKSINSTSILINNRNVSEYLTKSSNQSVNGNLIVDNLKVETLKVDNLNTNNRIFQQNIVDIYRQKSRSAPSQQEVFSKNQKFHGSIYVKNLILNSTINERNIQEIERNLLQLEGNIKYVGNFKFNYPMNVTKLSFYGKLNDIKAEELGKTWLQKYAKQQVFMVPQTFGTVSAKNGLHVEGNLNGFTINDLYTKTYWINRDEFLNEMVFENPIDITSGLTTQTLNHHYVPEEILCHNEIQRVLHPLTIEGDLEVLEDPLNVTIIKNIHVQRLKEYLQDDYCHQLIVENAYVKHGPPAYKTLNYQNIAKTLDAVWLANENVVLPKNVNIDDAYFEGLLEFEGRMNNMDLAFVKENYFSKSKSQNVASQVVLAETATFAEDIRADDVQLFGPIIEEKSGTQLDFMKFVENTLKTNNDPQHPPTITGNWSILEAVIDGNINQILINNLNLVDDVVHNNNNNNGSPYEIRAPKMFLKGAVIDNLMSDATSVLNKIPIGKWINEAVYLYENYTIYGTTTITSMNIFNDLQVMGELNNITFTGENLFLQDSKQILPKNLRIISHLKDEKRFLTNNIDNLYVDFINSEYMPKLMDNLIQWARDTEIASHLVFKEPINVDKYYGPPDYGTQQATNTHTTYALDHFEIAQAFTAHSSKVMHLYFNDSSHVIDVLALLDKNTQKIDFYKWHSDRMQFVQSSA
ncbi:uncharacterized protein LOC133337882 [Musca vetustissima]|uniref:uncharacterized protein LOC133337882 n=1 Tax=Musca vetustissima TaxID=27455 RepID=UPI002AB7CCFA|nr:uncharacterized protein LOC133337882 [Musca vetustissima]